MPSYDLLKSEDRKTVEGMAKALPSRKWICKVCPADKQVPQSNAYAVARHVASFISSGKRTGDGHIYQLSQLICINLKSI